MFLIVNYGVRCIFLSNFRCSQIPATSSATSAPSTWAHALTRVPSAARPSPPRQASSSISTSTAVSNPLSVSESTGSSRWPHPYHYIYFMSLFFSTSSISPSHIILSFFFPRAAICNSAYIFRTKHTCSVQRSCLCC